MSKATSASSKQTRKKEEKKIASTQEDVLQSLFQDMYRDRKKLYKLNFNRGLTFGAGSAIGGTVVIALIIWALSFFVNAPVIGEYIYDILQAIDQQQ